MILFWFIVAAIFILGLQSRLFQRFVLRHMKYERRFTSKTSYSGEQVELVEEMANAKWLPVPWLRVESQLSTHLHFKQQENLTVSSGQLYQNHKSFFTLPPYTKIRRTHRITCAKRGWYKLQTVTLTGGDLLGMSHTSEQIALHGELLVYPKPAEVPVHELPYHSWQGDQSVSRWIINDPFIIAGVRHYQAGDTFKQINWKATAKTGDLQVHQYDFTADRRLMVYLNVDDAEGMWRSVTDLLLIERGIEWAAGAAEAVIRQGMEVGFAANMPVMGTNESIHIEPRGGNEHLLGIFEGMAKLEIERTELFHHLIEREAQSGYSERDVLMITAYWNEELELQADRLRYNGNAVAIWLLTDQAMHESKNDEQAASTAEREEVPA
ncbi:uncharacterized protein (DUF58 family) [Paenibacillus endophyticus]|uniref:Uncharacterized protein (DUF58 family) n=1 Tax=Paenibacillus endophyticus TaxID=1294268 RepID=A0A7W5C6J5_9BACL|nr:DUF58 domain-containing protein [Paenibacillus endophyticus]MBB3151604.1 uncharacterized protein (DUF58 family) [Paenibacillus endophyticus]